MPDTELVRSWITLVTRELRNTRSVGDTGAEPMDRIAADARIAFIAADVRSRLRDSCRHWDEREFEALVQRIARMKSRWFETGRAD